MSLLGKYLPHPPSGSGSWGENEEPLDAGRWTVLRQNAVFLAQHNASRHIAEHEGFRAFWRNQVRVQSPARPLEFQNINRGFSRKTGGAWVDFGTHWFHPVPLPESSTGELAPFGVLTLRARWKVEGGHTAGAVLAMSPGDAGPDLARTADSARTTTTSASWADLTLSLSLTPDLLRLLPLVPAAGLSGAMDAYQRGNVRMGRIFFGAYCSSNTDSSGQRGSIVNISVHLSAAP